MEVRPLGPDEAAQVSASLRHPVVVADRLARQRRDECVYLVAWEHGSPVGQVLVHHRRPAALAVADTIDELPYLEDAFVLPEWRNRGIGTALLASAERATADRGDRGLSLAVSVGNAAARRLYARLGYVDAGVPLHRQMTSDRDTNGIIRSGNETVVDLVKRIDAPAERAAARDPSPGTAASRRRHRRTGGAGPLSAAG